MCRFNSKASRGRVPDCRDEEPPHDEDGWRDALPGQYHGRQDGVPSSPDTGRSSPATGNAHLRLIWGRPDVEVCYARPFWQMPPLLQSRHRWAATWVLVATLPAISFALASRCLGRPETRELVELHISLFRSAMCPAPRRCLGRATVVKQTIRWVGIERRQSGIEAEACPAIGTEDRVRLAHVDVDVRVILGWGLADALEFLHPNADLGDAAVVPELHPSALGVTSRFRRHEFKFTDITVSQQ